MSDVCGVGGSGQRHFSDEEAEALRKDESTSVIANKARRANGGKEADVTVRGDDKTLDQVMQAQKKHVDWIEAGAAVLHGADVGVAVGVAHLSVAGEIALTGGGAVLGVAAAHAGMMHMEKVKTERKEGAARDQLHGAIVCTLDVPDGFKTAEVKRLGITMSAQGPASKVADQITPEQRATLQMHCDRGMHGAKEMIEGGQTKEAFFAAHPDVKTRYDADAAYRNGFDALVWSKSQNDGGATYKAQLAKLESRDGWYGQACIQVRS